MLAALSLQMQTITAVINCSIMNVGTSGWWRTCRMPTCKTLDWSVELCGCLWWSTAASTAGRAWVLFSRTDLQVSVPAIQGILEWILLSSEQGEYIFFSINLNDASTFKLHILNRFYAISFCWTFALHIVLIHMDKRRICFKVSLPGASSWSCLWSE